MVLGSVSPSKGRARSTGPMHSVRRSRADVGRKPATGESTASTTEPSAPATATTAPSATSQRLARVKSMPSKLNADQKASSAATTPTSSVASARGRTPSAKRATKSAAQSQATTPTAPKPMPSAPKAMAPRAVPKEPKAMKEVTTNKPITSHKVDYHLFSLSLLSSLIFQQTIFVIFLSPAAYIFCCD